MDQEGVEPGQLLRLLCSPSKWFSPWVLMSGIFRAVPMRLFEADGD